MTCFPQSAGVVLDEQGATVLIEIDSSLYPEDVALRAAYWLSDRGYVHLTKRPDGPLIAEIRLKDGADGEPLAALCGEFCNSLVDFALRARVATETRDIQEALLQRAFTALVPKPPCD